MQTILETTFRFGWGHEIAETIDRFGVYVLILATVSTRECNNRTLKRDTTPYIINVTMRGECRVAQCIRNAAEAP